MTSMKDRLPDRMTTDRLVLVPPSHAHVSDITRLANNARVHAMMSRLPFPYGEDDARFFVDVVAAEPQERSYVILLDGQTMIGVIGFRDIAGQPPSLGYWLGEPHWGHGYATEAARALVAAAREAGFPALQSRALLENAASRNVLRKAGFVETGESIEPGGNLDGKIMMLMHQDLR